jgi:hypothetical protein
MFAVAVWFSVLGTIGGLGLLWSSVQQLRRGLAAPGEHDAPRWLARGLREVLIVLCGATIALGYAFDSTVAMGIGAVILAEELYEIAVVLAILDMRAGPNPV